MFEPRCVCGRKIHFYKTHKYKHCLCGVLCFRDKFGFWSIGKRDILFSPKDKWMRGKDCEQRKDRLNSSNSNRCIGYY